MFILTINIRKCTARGKRKTTESRKPEEMVERLEMVEKSEEEERRQSLESRDWSSLPGPALLGIFQKLTGRVGFLAFPLVCNVWRNAISGFPPSRCAFLRRLPPLIYHFPEDYVFDIRNLERKYVIHRNLKEGGFLIGYSHGYLIFTNEDYFFDIPYTVFLVHPFTKERIQVFQMLPPPTNRYGAERDNQLQALLTSSPHATPCFLLLFSRETFWFCNIVGGRLFRLDIRHYDIRDKIVDASNRLVILMKKKGYGGSGQASIFTFHFKNISGSTIRTYGLPVNTVDHSKSWALWSRLIDHRESQGLWVVQYHWNLLKLFSLDKEERRWVALLDLKGCALFGGRFSWLLVEKPEKWGFLKDSVYYSNTGTRIYRFSSENEFMFEVNSLPRLHRKGFQPLWISPVE